MSVILAAAPLLALAVPQHSGHHMPGMTMPAPKTTAPAKPRRKPAPTRARKPAAAAAKAKAAPQAAACSPEHAAMGHCTPTKPAPMPTPPSACSPEHAAMGHCAPTATPPPTMPAMGTLGTALPAGSAPPPVVADADYADRIWGRDAMAPARALLRREHGGGSFSQVMLNLAEVTHDNGYRWDGEAWFGGDIHRLAIKSEGEGGFGDRLDHGEVQALYSRAIDPYFNLQAGVRQDFGMGPARTYAVVGIEGLAPYWFDVEGALFLSDKGDLLARAEASYDQRITQRLILQPRVEINLAAGDMPANRIGSGLSDAEVGVRLRYEIAREFAPYVGVQWERRFGDTARFARAAGEDSGGVSAVLGVRAWF